MVRRLAFVFLLLCVTNAPARDKSDEWIEVRAPHFAVVTNAGEKKARYAADQFERMRAVFEKVFPGIAADSGSPITVIAVRNEKEFRALEPEAYLAKGQLKLAGLFLRAPEKNFILLRLDAEGDHPYATVYHEYTHFLTRNAGEWLPLWLNEGLAEFYENTDIRDKDALLGKPSEANLNLLNHTRLLPLATLFAVDSSSPYYREENKASIFYAESWALTHYLWINDFQAKTTLISDYGAMAKQKVDPVVAATRAFGDLQVLQKALEKYVQSPLNQLQMKGAVTVNDAEFKVQPLTLAQSEALRAEFLAYNQRGADAKALLEQVLKDDPNNVSAHETMGYLEFRQRHLEEARKWYEQAVQLDSQSYLANYYFAAIAMSGGQLKPEDEARVENSLRTAIKLNPSFAPAYDRLAVFFGMRHQNLEEAYMLALHAVSIDPENVTYRLNSANVLMQRERGQDAVRVIQNASKVAKSPEDIARVQNALQMAEQYQAAKEAFEAQAQRAEAGAGPAAQPDGPPAAVDQESSAPVLKHAATVAQGPHRDATGIIKDVQCSMPAKMDLKLETDKGTVVLHTDNYYKVLFSALGFAPTGTLRPCSDLAGRPARVEFVDSDNAPQITSVELQK